MTLLLMAAGSGSRYGRLKQFDDLGPKGEFLMEFSIFDALQNGFQHIVVITKKENQEFLRKHLSERLKNSIKLDVLVQRIEDIPEASSFSGERKKPWGTAHAVWTARDVIKAPFVIINADDYYGQNAFKGAAEFIKKQKSTDVFGLIGYQLKDTLSDFGAVSRGVCTVKDKQLQNIVERTKISKNKGVIKDEDSDASACTTQFEQIHVRRLVPIFVQNFGSITIVLGAKEVERVKGLLHAKAFTSVAAGNCQFKY